ncbi:MAG TPA: bifunctional metallophosphatase/5'-nucleotidase [Candidatus Lachnoclostridium pullistercoris]|uniref:Bifunctional metallophosphatase/5'-nucleotidase n=1 Tax=Candidatus Lachnoclostridium pullistercoris TaxID=2838632 RepID=A0A9D2PEL4_9FIRM|nr:bifunctional metallophosphatase/5'-nucleotidase [Candidatus Lachnoclostridium pullistercoris]
MREMWKKRFLPLILALSMIFAAAPGFSAQAAENPDQEIVILYTNDVHCGVDDNIGYAGLALYKKQMKEETPYVALVDAGDAIQGAPIGTLSEGGDIISIMNQVGYDFAIPGNHEFDYGMDRFLELAGQLNCGYYSCNLTDLRTGTTVFEPYKIMDFGDTQVAFVGVSTPESFTKSTPKYFQDASGAYIYSFCEDETGQGLYSRVQESVDSARAAGADYVILVSHLGNEGVTPRWSSSAVVAATNGIDAVIDGHSHETVPAAVLTNMDGKAVPMSQTGTKLADIGKMTIGTDGSITTELIDHVSGEGMNASYTVQSGDSLSRIAKRELGSYQLWNVIYEANRDQIRDPNVIRPGQVLVIPGSQTGEGEKAEDPETARFIDQIMAQFNETLSTPLATTSVELTVNDAETGERRVRRGETNLGDLTADAYRYVLGAEIGFSNGGGIRDNIAAGTITYNDTLRVFPFGNMGCVAEVTGQQIKDALEMGARNYPEESGAFQQVSGLTYTIDSSVPSSVQVDSKGNFTGVAGPYRVTDIMVNGEPLDLNRTYTLASHNYLLKDGGDGMTMFAGCQIVKDEVMADVDLLSAYIRDNLGGTVGAEYENPAGQGRITIR